jgi:hypothetical protein
MMSTIETTRRRLADLLGDSSAIAAVPVYGVTIDGIAPSWRVVERIRRFVAGLPRAFLCTLAAAGARVEITPGACIGRHPLARDDRNRAAMGLAVTSRLVAIVASESLGPEHVAAHELGHLLDFLPVHRGGQSFASRPAWPPVHDRLNATWGDAISDGIRDCPHEGFAEAFARCFGPPVEPDHDSFACPPDPPPAALEYFRQLERELA